MNTSAVDHPAGMQTSKTLKPAPEPPVRSRRARLMIGLTLLLVGCFVALGVAEIAVRVFYPHARDHVVPAGLFEIDQQLGWKLRPGKAGTHRSRYFEAVYRSNRLGFRDVEREPEKPAGVYRLLVYGDSQIFGWGVPANERFTNLLEERLGSVELWNLAVPGYGLGQEVIAYETTGTGYEADEVVFVLSRSTLSRLPFHYIYRKPKPRFRLDASGTLQLDPVDTGSSMFSDRLYRLLSPFYLPYFVDRRLQSLRHRNTAGGDSPVGPKFGDLARQVLLRAKWVAAANGERITILATFPDRSLVEELPRFADDNGIEVLWIDLDPQDGSLIFGPHDRHWTPEAHRRIAEQLYGPLSERRDVSARGPKDRR